MGIFKKLKSTWGALDWSRKHWKSILVIAVFCISLVIMIGGSFALSGVQLITVLLIGGILIFFSFIKMLYDFLKDMARRDIDKRALEDKINRLSKELQFERSGGIKVNIRPILEMTFLEADCTVTKFFDIYLDENGNEIIKTGSEKEQEEEEIIKGPEKHYHFLGGLTAKFRAKYGIDLQKVYVKRDDESQTFFVSGAKPSFRGTGGFPQMRWEGSVCLMCREFLGGWVTDAKGVELERDYREKYNKLLQESLANGPEQLDWVKEPLQRNINRVLKILARNYKVVTVEHPKEGFIPLPKYLSGLGLSNGTDRLFLP